VSVVFRADEAPARDRLEYWRDVVARAIGPHDIRSAEVGAGDRLRLGELGPVVVGELSAGVSALVRRGPREIRHTDAEDDLCKVHVTVEGGGVVQHNGREVSLAPGDLTLIDLSRPALWAMPPMRCIAVAFPRTLLPLHPDELTALTAVRIPGDAATGRLVSTLVRQLPAQLDTGDPAAATRLGTAVVDLMAAALLEHIGHPLPEHTERRVLLERIHAFIEERLGDPRLSPATIAAAHHVSVRYLYKLFESQETTVAGWIRRRRLERCRRDLLDPALGDVPVSTIAARWGLTNPAHFSRVFRTTYGVAPVEYRRVGDRRLALADESPDTHRS
jgi:AraC-like DNA-binding protein